MPSRLTSVEVRAIELHFGVVFPPMFFAYLLARYHLFNQVHSRKYSQLIQLPAIPFRDPLGPLQAVAGAWHRLLDSGFFAFADWGDGWGPVCFDLASPNMEGDYPIVWMDHEHLCRLGPDKFWDRSHLGSMVHPLFDSFADFFADVFQGNEPLE